MALIYNQAWNIKNYRYVGDISEAYLLITSPTKAASLFCYMSTLTGLIGISVLLDSLILTVCISPIYQRWFSIRVVAMHALGTIGCGLVICATVYCRHSRLPLAMSLLFWKSLLFFLYRLHTKKRIFLFLEGAYRVPSPQINTYLFSWRSLSCLFLSSPPNVLVFF